MRAILLLALLGCTTERDDDDDACEPAPCTSCALGYYDGAIPRGATLVTITSDAREATASVWFDGTAADVPSLPALLDIPRGASTFAATTTHGAVAVAFCSR